MCAIPGCPDRAEDSGPLDVDAGGCQEGVGQGGVRFRKDVRGLLTGLGENLADQGITDGMRPEDSMPMITSSTAMLDPSTILELSTMPTQKPAKS